MNGYKNDDLARARALMTIFRVWEVAVREGKILAIGQTPRRDGLYKSPFRDDGRKGSFSICYGGRGFKDHGGDGIHGDAWDFAKLCWPDLSDRELADKYIDISGIARSLSPPKPAPGQPAPPPVDPKVRKAMKSIERREARQRQENAIYEQVEEQYKPRVEVKPVPLWPEFVRERYFDGWRVLRGAVARMSELAKDRGWPTEWVLELVTMGLISYPLERWMDPSDVVQRRQKAFIVHAPEIIYEGPENDLYGRANLRPVGYHQRWFTPPKGDQPAQKGWLYVPCVPNHPRSVFEKSLTDYGADRGVTVENKSGLFPPLPFVLGDLGRARVIVLLEGQWDAISFFGACGYFEDANPPVGIAVFGIRGAQGLDVFLAYWSKWLRLNNPLVWIIADNDRAGQTWLKAPPAEVGMPRSPSFSEKLEHAGCRRVLTSWLKLTGLGKDFNDYYRAAKPGPAQMAAWMRSVGVIKENGQWA